MFYIGVDFGQSVDFTAIAVLEREECGVRPWMEPDFKGLSVRWLERMPLGTPFPDVVRRIEEIVAKLEWNCSAAVDATGLGAPVVDMLRNARLGCDLSPVVITAGDRPRQERGRWYVPRRDLIGVIQMLLECEQLRIAKDLRECPTLVRELVSMRLKGDSREHDDLVFAVALACWLAERPLNGFGRGRLI